MWTELTTKDPALADKCAVIMRKMDRAYRKLTAGQILAFLVVKKGRVFLYERGDVNIVLVLVPNARLRKLRVFTCGVVGSITPEAALDLAVDKLVDVMNAGGMTNVYAIRSAGLDHAPINRFFDLVVSHPKLRVTVEHQMADRDAWNIALSPGPVPVP
ncbi:MAG: hypothetical protein U1D30_21995 [Planctomycetota bacterium]